MPLILQILYLPIKLLKWTRNTFGMIASIPSFFYFSLFNVNFYFFL